MVVAQVGEFFREVREVVANTHLEVSTQVPVDGDERWERFMARAQAISAAKLAARVGTRTEAIVDEVDADGATCRTHGDAPEIDGNLYIDAGFAGLKPGDIVTVEIDEASEYDLWGSRI